MPQRGNTSDPGAGFLCDPPRNPRRSSNVLDSLLGVRPLRSCHTSSAVVRLLTCMRVCRKLAHLLYLDGGGLAGSHTPQMSCVREVPSYSQGQNPFPHLPYLPHICCGDQQLAARENGYPTTPLMLPIFPHRFKYGVSINIQPFDIAVGFHHYIAGCHSTSKEPHIRKA